MRYIGNKTSLLDIIKDTISNYPDIRSITDCFAGSGSVSKELSKNWSISSNDNMYYSYVLQYCILKLQNLDFSKIGKTDEDILYYFNNIPENELISGFIHKNYTPSGLNEYNRMYFTEENGKIIDTIRIKTNEWKDNNLITDNEYFWIIGNLLNSVSKIANTTGVFGAYLKSFNKTSSRKLQYVNCFTEYTENNTNECTCMDGRNLIDSQESDLLYMDPPYNNRQYCDNYHLLETIAKYDTPEIHGKTGNRSDVSQKSNFCKTRKVRDEFHYYFSHCKSAYVLLSYSSDGIVPKDDLISIINTYGTILSFQEIPYRKYKSSVVGTNVVNEFLILYNNNNARNQKGTGTET